MGFFFSKKGSIVSDYFEVTENQSVFRAGEMCEVAVYDDRLELSGTLSKNKATLPMNRVTDVYWGIETEIASKNKSVIGRAVAGGLLFGGMGAIVGAVSGVQPKQIKKNRTVFIISYTSSDGQDNFLQFEDTRNYKGYKVYTKIRDRLPVQSPQDIIL